MFLQLITFIISAVCFLYYYFTKTFNYWKIRNVKGPEPIPFFGNFKRVALRKQHMGMQYSEVYQQYPDEKVVGLYRMTSPALLIRDLDIVRQILVKDFESFPERGTFFSDEGLGQNIFHSDAETWKILRNRLSSVFTPSKFKSMFHLLDDRGDRATSYIENITKSEPEQDVYQLLLKHSAGITMLAVFGLDIDIVNSTSRVFEIFDEHLLTSSFNELDMLIPGILKMNKLSIISDIAIKFCHEVVTAGIEKISNRKSELGNAMDVLLNMRKEGYVHINKEYNVADNIPKLKITEDLLAAQAWILYVAGFGNTTLTMTYALYHLAYNSNIQEKLIQEIDTIADKNNGKLTYDELIEMKYLDMVFHEVLRMHPLTNAVVRSACKDIKLEGLEFVIKKGLTIVMSPYAIQHDEKYYPDPETFNPERFSADNVKSRHPTAFLSFGAGRRSCIGSRLAKILFGVCITKLLSKFRVETTCNTIRKIEYDPRRLLLTPEKRIVLKFVPRVR